MRLMLRLTSFVLLVAAVAAGVQDSIQSVADTGLRLTTLRSVWNAFSPASLARAELAASGQQGVSGLHGGFLWLVAQPFCAVLLGLALMFWMAGYRRIPAAGRFAA